jgi:ABC-type branched-subunit amino acid transport system ATPase component
VAHAGERLTAEGVDVSFAGVRALAGVDLDLREGEILGLIGPNGAGKTTLVNVLTGYQRPSSGRVDLAGRDVTRWAPERRAKHGLARTFQAVRLFGRLTAAENVEVAAVATGTRSQSARARARDILATMGLSHRADAPASSLPLGEERLLGIARALATAPRWLLLDEPAAGLNEEEGDRLFESLLAVRQREGCGLLVIEHDMRLIMRLCERIQVLESGRTISVGTPEETRTDERVLQAYLGSSRGAVDAAR